MDLQKEIEDKADRELKAAIAEALRPIQRLLNVSDRDVNVLWVEYISEMIVQPPNSAKERMNVVTTCSNLITVLGEAAFFAKGSINRAAAVDDFRKRVEALPALTQLTEQSQAVINTLNKENEDLLSTLKEAQDELARVQAELSALQTKTEEPRVTFQGRLHTASGEALPPIYYCEHGTAEGTFCSGCMEAVKNIPKPAFEMPDFSQRTDGDYIYCQHGKRPGIETCDKCDPEFFKNA